MIALRVHHKHDYKHFITLFMSKEMDNGVLIVKCEVFLFQIRIKFEQMKDIKKWKKRY